VSVYDCTFILNSQLDETGLEGQIAAAKDLVQRHGGKIVSDNRIGLRRLAYEIQKMTQGYYVSLVFDGTGEAVSELERSFRMNEACLRFLTCLYQEFSPRDEKILGRPMRSGGYRGRRFDRGDSFERHDSGWNSEGE